MAEDHTGPIPIDSPELRLQEIEQRYPGRFSDEERAELLARFRALHDSVKIIREHPVANAEEPAATFRPVRTR